MPDRFDGFGDKVYHRVRNLSRSWICAYAAGIGFRYLTNYLFPNGQLAQSLFQTDEIIRGPIEYAGLYALDKISRRFTGKHTYLPKMLALLISFAFEASQHLSPVPNRIIGNLGMGVDSTVLGSIEDVIMDATIIASYKQE